MLWSELSKYWDKEKDSDMDRDDYIVYTPKEGYVIQLEEGEYSVFTTDYMQVVRDVEDGNETYSFVFQIESSLDDPINFGIENGMDHTIIPARIFKRITVD